MTQTTVVVRWATGLHLRTAAKLVHTAQAFQSAILLKHRGRVANVRSILSVIALCATMGAALDLEVNGDDEQEAARAIEQVFSAGDDAAR